MKILHLSDIHLDYNSEYDITKKILPALIKSLSNSSMTSSVDLIIISGDLINEGNNAYSNIEKAFTNFNDLILEELIHKLEISKDKIILNIGNHDINRLKINQFTESGLKSDLNNDSVIENIITEQRNTEGMEISRVSEYKKFERKFYEGLNSVQVTNFDTTFKLIIDNVNVGISSLNSSWRCNSKEDKGNLIIGERQVDLSYEQILDDDFKIAVFHHPLDYLLTIDKDNVSPKIFREYDFVFNGHHHSTNAFYQSGLYGDVFISCAPGLLCPNKKDQKHPIAYTLIDFDYNSRKIECHFMKYNSQQDSFIIYSEKGDNGKLNTSLQLRTKDINKSLKERIYKDFRTDKLINLNEHLINNGLDTNSPQKIDEIFVMPSIKKLSDFDKDLNEDSDLSIDEILNINKNILIFGKKESGKTVLLDKFVIELIINGKYRKIPAYIDFSNLGNHEVYSAIRSYLGLKIEEMNVLLKNNEIVLLIDNISFSDSSRTIIKRIMSFHNEYPSIRIIASSELLIENKLPSEFLDHETINGFDMNVFFIQSFGGKQIRQFISKWFKNRQEIDFMNNLEKLTDYYMQFNLPRTPMSVAIFLWMIEKQESRAVNYSSVMNLFIEDILEKIIIKDVFSSSFDYENKIRLLASIAEYMLKENNPNYMVEYGKLITFIHEYLKSKSWEDNYSANDLLKYFINKRIFDNCGDNVKFRFPCYYEFFIARQMEFDKKFGKYVFRKDNYLNFTSEIKYYTGLNRGDKNILSGLFKWFKERFDELNNIVWKANVDDFFETPFSLFKNMDLAKLKEKRPNSKKLSERYDEIIKKLPEKESIPERIQTDTSKGNLDKLLDLMSNVLRNLEEVNDSELKKEIYKYLIKSTISFMVLHRFMILKKANDTNGKLPKLFGGEENLIIYLIFQPTVFQLILNGWVGTVKLAKIIEMCIEEDCMEPQTFEIQKFLSAFIYSDLKGKDYFKKIKTITKSFNKNFILDQSIIKLINYYFIRTKENSDSEKQMLDLIAELQIKVKHFKKIDKGRIINSLKQKKYEK